MEKTLAKREYSKVVMMLVAAAMMTVATIMRVNMPADAFREGLLIGAAALGASAPAMLLFKIICLEGEPEKYVDMADTIIWSCAIGSAISSLVAIVCAMCH